jgi:hypothetical protein
VVTQLEMRLATPTLSHLKMRFTSGMEQTLLLQETSAVPARQVILVQPVQLEILEPPVRLVIPEQLVTQAQLVLKEIAERLVLQVIQEQRDQLVLQVIQVSLV